MYNFRARFALLSIRGKIIAAFVSGCIVIALSLVIARIVFKETFNTISAITKPDPKLAVINDLFHKIQQLDHSQKMQVLALQEQSYKNSMTESEGIVQLLDSLERFCAADTLQTRRIARMKNILYERDALFMNYLKFRYSIIKNNPLSKDINNLSAYISKNIQRGDSNIVKTTKKNITTTTISELESAEKKEDKKESFFKRVFSRKKNKDEAQPAAQKMVTENIQETIDTFALARRDSFMKDMAQAISTLEKDRYSRRTRLAGDELKLAEAGNIFINELQQLLRQVQSEEILELQSNTESLSSVFNTAFTWMEIILCVFVLLILVLIILIFSDISRSNKARLQLLEAKEKAEYLEQAKHRFLANMSHEIRTPLQSIIGYAEQVKDATVPKREAIEAIYSSSEHLLQIVNEVLDYSRIVSGKFVIEKHDFDMAEVIAEVADVMEGQAEKKQIDFRFKSNIPRNVLFSGDPFRLKQILFNLLGNAIKFTNTGSVSFFVTSRRLDSLRTEFVFEIKDTGIGMTGKELTRIFNSFEQAGESIQRSFGGTGLGLSIAKQLTEMQGGTITVSSEKDKGSGFKVILCYNEAPAGTTLPQKFSPTQLPSYTGRVVVLDDDAFILQLCATIFQKYKISHVCYASPGKLLGDTWDEGVTLVLLDIRMPEMSGTEVLARLKRKAGAHVKFVALTAQALAGEKAGILAHGFDLVLLKPFKEKDLLQLLDTNTLKENEVPVLPADELDLSSIEMMCVNDKDLLKKTLELFVSKAMLDLDVFTKGVHEKDRHQLGASAHKLAAKTGQVGLHTLAERLRELERRAMDAHFAFDTQQLNDIATRINQAITQVKERA